jgi:hypothetical protein
LKTCAVRGPKIATRSMFPIATLSENLACGIWTCLAFLGLKSRVTSQYFHALCTRELLTVGYVSPLA